MAGSHQHIFSTLILSKMLFKMMKKFGNTDFWLYFVFFSKFKFFVFHLQNFSIKVEKTIQEIKSFDRHFPAKVPSQQILEKNQIFFSKRLNFSPGLNHKKLAGASKLHSSCPEELFGDYFLQKFLFLLNHFLTLNEKSSEFWQKSFSRVFKNAFNVSR